MPRPDQPPSDHPGYTWKAEQAGEEWRPYTGRLTCRRRLVGNRTCTTRAVAEMRRGVTRPAWWAYCASHMYGRWIEDGKVMHWILRRDE